MLFGLALSAVVSSAPPELAEPAPLRLALAVLSGVTALEAGPVATPLGVGTGGRLALSWRLFERMDLGPAFDLRHDFASGRTDLFGSARLVGRVGDRFALTMALGYGVGSFAAPVPQHLLVLTNGVAVRGGHCWFSLETDVVFRLVVTDTRTLRVFGAVTFEHPLLGG